MKNTLDYQHPLIVLIGATGCGKTKLSLELAKHFNGEIISADSMQIYKGLDLATNKATILERQQIPHHLIDMIDPFQQFTVLDFQKLALKSIKSIVDRGKFPIIVGGTNYYIESILWDTLVGSENLNEEEFQIVPNDDQVDETLPQLETVEDLLKMKITYKSLKSISDEVLHQFLKEIDPESAKNLSVHNRRKVIRCLQVFQQTGRTMTDILDEQRSKGSRHGGPLRFQNSIILWVDCEKTVLDKRLDDRVDEMLRQGLIDELTEFHRNFNELRFKQNRKIDYTEGIFQAIGLKEFHQYLLMNEEQRNTYEGQLKLGHGIILLKQRTKSYVTRQLKWIRRRFLIDSNIRNVPNVYRLDTTDLEKWNENVFKKSIFIIENFLKALNEQQQQQQTNIFEEILNPLSIRIKSEQNENDDQFISGQFYCDICNIYCSGGKSFQEHIRSKKHLYHKKIKNNYNNNDNNDNETNQLNVAIKDN